MPNHSLPYHPKQGEVLKCDYSNLIDPEMSKVRWVVVVSPKFLNRPNLCTVVPLSTTPPKKVEGYHVLLDKDPAPKSAEGTVVWAKCDMLMTVSFSRLSAYHDGRRLDGKRNYVNLNVSIQELGRIKLGVLHALGLASLWK
jgi:mRNA interferase MazF